MTKIKTSNSNYTQFLTKLENSNCDYTQKLKLCQNSKTQIVKKKKKKLKLSFDKTENLHSDKTKKYLSPEKNPFLTRSLLVRTT